MQRLYFAISALGALTTYVVCNYGKRNAHYDELKGKETLYLKQEATLADLIQEVGQLRDSMIAKQLEICRLTTLLEAAKAATVAIENEKKRFESQLLENIQTSTQTALLAAHQKVHSQNRSDLLDSLAPFQTQLTHVHQQMQQVFTTEAKERHTLTHELKRLQGLNQQLAQEALNLTQALKGQSKLQGNWGELVLSRVLESAGLRKGQEFELQMSLQGEAEGNKLQPDAVVFLPEGKAVVIDAKVSLLGYEQYYRASSDVERKEATQKHLCSIKSHMKSLHKKAYHRSPELRTLNYVLLFMPIEGAMQLALEADSSLLHEAQKLNLLLVSPSSLLVALKTVHTLWQFDKQAVHAKTIVQKAASLYDKFRLLLESLQSAKLALTKAQGSYDEALKRLACGSNNLIQQVEEFKQWGVAIKRPIPEVNWTSLISTEAELSQLGTAAPLEDALQVSPNKPITDPLDTACATSTVG